MTRNITRTIRREVRRLTWLTLIILFLIFAFQSAAYYVVLTLLLGRMPNDWMLEFSISTVVLILSGALAFLVIAGFGNRINQRTMTSVNQELRQLRTLSNRAKSLQEMASELRATLSFERVVEQALDVCSLALEEMGIPRQSLVGAVFLYNGDDLVPVATRRFLGPDHQKRIEGKRGIVGAALAQAEPAVTKEPASDPELRRFLALQNCLTAVCIPLRAGFQIFGAMVIGSDAAVEFNEQHFDLFGSVADQSVIALQNAQLYQQLEEEKQRLIEADEEARRELARDLHDGPTQSIAAIAMRINFVRTLLARDPQQAIAELEKVEELAKQTSIDIRGMLFTLRPLVLETQGLGPAVDNVIKRISETDGIRMRLVGSDYGNLLSENAQSVVFSIVEEALGNARKYANANRVEVRFWQEDDLFVARVQDDGVGFSTDDVKRHYSARGSLGMVNMQERAERINGTCRVESVPGQGTTVTLLVPLEKHGRSVAVP